MEKDEICYCRFLDGDESGLEELIGMYKFSMTMFINSIVNNMDVSKELMIDTFAKLVVSGSKFEKKSSLKTYLFQIARNEAIHYLKKYKKLNNVNIDDFEYLASSDTEEYSPEDKFLNDEKNRMLHQAIGKLIPDYRMAVYLVYFENMSYADVGKVMKTTIKRVTNLVYRGKKSLKLILENEGYKYDER